MREVCVFVSKSKKKPPIGGWLIMLIQWRKFSHIGLKWTTSRGREIIYQASGHQVNFTGGYWVDQQHKIVDEFYFQLDDKTFGELSDFCVDEAGAPYSITKGIGAWASRCLGLERNAISRDPRSYVCSLLMAKLLENYILKNWPQENWLIKKRKEWLETSLPEDLYDYLIYLRKKEVCHGRSEPRLS
jgi:hypothetical protein